ncbi:unnamed protein product [Allacma fusca]|uniref:Uncharacterized protein n=1 Tax=Allacma fusca TaxID=39272 RepID=A0A8J2LNE9_9HEXA|nr:unnamed protein product [Allacma fusca]
MRYSHAGLTLLLVLLQTAHYCQSDILNETTTVIKRQIDEKEQAEASRESRGVFTDWFLQQKGVIDDSEEHLDTTAAHADRNKHRRSKFLTHWCDWFGMNNHTTNDSRICGSNNTEDTSSTTDPSQLSQGGPLISDSLNSPESPVGLSGDRGTTTYQRIIVIHKVKQSVREKRSRREIPSNFIDAEQHPSPKLTPQQQNSSCSSSSSAEESNSVETGVRKKPYFFV